MAEKSNQGVQLARVHLEESRKSLTDRGELGKRSSGRWIYIVVGLAALVGGVLAVVLGIRLPSRKNSHTDQGSWSVELKVSAPSFDKEDVSAFNTKLALVVGLPEALIDTVATAAGSDFRLIASASLSLHLIRCLHASASRVRHIPIQTSAWSSDPPCRHHSPKRTLLSGGVTLCRI